SHTCLSVAHYASTRSLHDALPISNEALEIKQHRLYGIEFDKTIYALACANMMIHKDGKTNLELADTMSNEAAHWMHDLNWDEHRSEEHTSELQSRFDLVCRRLLEK